MRKSILSLLLMMIAMVSFAQKKEPVWGYLKDSVTNEPIVLASIANFETKKTVMSSNTGRFKIEVSDNQILSFAAVGYFFDTIAFHKNLLKNDTLYLYLKPLARSLGNVTVYTKSNNAYREDSIERRKDFMGDRVQYAIPVAALSNTGAGLGINLDRYSKHEKEKRKAFAFFEANEKEEYINYRYSAELVNKYSGLKDDALQNFMQESRPTYEWLRKHKTEEDIKYYINDQLKKMKK
ncbi:MAG: hypothetical protein WCP74_08630 [Sphingobacteriia bacterium]